MRKRRRRIGVLVFFAALASFLLALDLYLLLRPEQVAARVRAALAATFARPFRVGAIDFSIFRGISVRGLEVGDPRAPDLSVEEASVEIDWRRLALHEIRVLRPSLHIRRDGQGVSLASLFQPDLFRREGPAEFPSLSITVADARLSFHDESWDYGEVHDFAIGGIDMEIGLDPERGLDVHGSIRDPLWKSLRFAGDFAPGDRSFDFSLEARKVRCGPQLRSLLPPPVKRTFTQFQWEGIGDADLHATNRGRPRVEYWGEIRIHQGGMRFEIFPYPVKDVTGTIEVKTGPHLVLKDLYGVKDRGEYGCNGDVFLFPKGIDDRIDIRVWAKNLPVDEDLENALPPEVRPVFRRFAPAGRADARARIFGAAKPRGIKDDIHWEVLADWREGTVRFEDFPIPVSGASARIEVRDERFSIEGLKGEALSGTIEADGFASNEKLAVTVHGSGLKVGASAREWLPSGGRDIFEAVAPEGTIDAWVLVRGERENGRLEPTFLARLVPRAGLSARYRGFPLPLEVRSGEVFLTPEGGRLEAVRAVHGPLSVTVTGTIGAAGHGTPVALEIAAEKIPIGEETLGALSGAPREWASLFGLESGEIERARLVADKPAGPAAPAFSGEVEFRGVRARPRLVRYPIEGLSGAVRFSPREIEIGAIAGRAGDGEITGKGRIALACGLASTAKIELRGLAVDARLREALEGRARAVFDRLSPSGLLDFALTFEQGREAIEPVLKAGWRDGRMALDFFPYPVTGISADLAYRAGKAKLERLAGRIGESDLSASGESSAAGARLSVEVPALALDRRLREALPPDMRRAFAEADPAGCAHVRLNLAWDERLRSRLLFNAGIGLRCERLDVGIALKQLEGKVDLEGSFGLDGAGLTFRGAVDLRRALWKNQVLSSARARIGLAGGLFEARELRAALLGGILAGEVFAFTSEPRTFGGRLALSGGRLEKWADVRYGGKRRASGRLDCAASFLGRAGEPVRGEGALTIGEAHLGELPPVASILNFLSFEPPTTAVWDDVKAAFRLDGGTILIDRLNLSSSALSFLGKGQIKGGELWLRVVHELGRPWLGGLPVIGPVWRFLKGNLIEFEITGTLDEPRVKPIPVKVVTDPVRWLFGDRPDEQAPRAPSE